MALRVMGPQIPEELAPLPEESMPLPEDAGMLMEEDAELPPSAMEQGKVTPIVANYKGPELGPFACAHCGFFQGDGTCALVAGPIEPEGLCNLFTQAVESEEAAMPMAAQE